MGLGTRLETRGRALAAAVLLAVGAAAWAEPVNDRAAPVDDGKLGRTKSDTCAADRADASAPCPPTRRDVKTPDDDDPDAPAAPAQAPAAPRPWPRTLRVDRQAVVRASAATAVAAAVVFDGDADVPRPVADAPRPTGPCRIGGSVYRLVTGDDCLAAMKAQAVFDRLAPAAGFAKHDLSFRLMADGSSASMAVNAYYNDPMKTVYVTHGMLRQYGADAAVLVAVIAHELGHAVTDREMPFTSASCYAGGLPCPYDRRQFEALADMRGGQIAARAGFPAKMVAAGFETFFGSLNVRFGPEHDERYVHPSDRDRWLNVAAYQAAINRKHESLAPGFVPAIGLEAFTPSGVIVPSALVPEARLKTYARAAMDAQLPPKPEALDAPVLYNYAIARQFLRDRASRAIVAAVDRFVEPPDSRKAPFDRGVAPWAPLRWDVPEAMTARLLKAISGDAAEELVRSLPPLLRKN